jgi:ABC-2 type transport system permease protein
MRDALALYGRYVAISLRAQLQYRASFAMTSLGQFAITVIEFFGIWALFARFGRIQTWSLAEVALFYGVVNVSFALADTVSRGFDLFSLFVKRGEFDRMLLRPRSTVLQVAGYDFALWRIGRLARACCCSWERSSAARVSSWPSSWCRRRWPSGPPRRWS